MSIRDSLWRFGPCAVFAFLKKWWVNVTRHSTYKTIFPSWFFPSLKPGFPITVSFLNLAPCWHSFQQQLLITPSCSGLGVPVCFLGCIYALFTSIHWLNAWPQATASCTTLLTHHGGWQMVVLGLHKATRLVKLCLRVRQKNNWTEVKEV